MQVDYLNPWHPWVWIIFLYYKRNKPKLNQVYKVDRYDIMNKNIYKKAHKYQLLIKLLNYIF